MYVHDMIKAVLLQLQASLSASYKPGKMAPELNTNQSDFSPGLKGISLLKMSYKPNVINALCEPVSHAAKMIGSDSYDEKYLAFPSLMKGSLGNMEQEDQQVHGNGMNLASFSKKGFLNLKDTIQCNLGESWGNHYMLQCISSPPEFTQTNKVPVCVPLKLTEAVRNFLTEEKEALCIKNQISSLETSYMNREVPLLVSSTSDMEKVENMDFKLTICCGDEDDWQSSSSPQHLAPSEITDCQTSGIRQTSQAKDASEVMPSCSGAETSSSDLPVCISCGASCDEDASSESGKPAHNNSCDKENKTMLIRGSKQKRQRPSAKKRQHRKLRFCNEAEVTPDQEDKQNSVASDSLANDDVKEGLELLITDFLDCCIDENSESNIPVNCEGQGQSSFSLFVNAADLTDSDESSDENCYDYFCYDDGFSEDDCGTSGLLSGALLTNTDCASPLTLHFSYFDDESSLTFDGGLDEYQTDIDDNFLLIDPEVKKQIDEANSKWLACYGDVYTNDDLPSAKVHFPSEESNLQTVFMLDPDEVDAYREARIGNWEEAARDRQRFQNRIDEIEEKIGYCFEHNHREHIYKRLYMQSL